MRFTCLIGLLFGTGPQEQDDGNRGDQHDMGDVDRLPLWTLLSTWGKTVNSMLEHALRAA